MSDNKFGAILSAAKQGKAVDEPTAPSTEKAKPAPKKQKAVLAPSTPKVRKKKVGKSRDPEFEQATTYIRKETHQKVKVALLQRGSKQDFSDLVEELLTEWLKT